jgi:hypothetical protein
LVKSLEEIDKHNLLDTVGYSAYDVDDLKALLSEMEAVALYNSGIFEETDDSAENVHAEKTNENKANAMMIIRKNERCLILDKTAIFICV